MKKFISSIAIIVFVFSLSINLVGAQTLSSSSIANILNSLLKANLIPAQGLQTAKSMLGSYSAYDAAYSSCYAYTRDLTLGSTGADVVALQEMLEINGYLQLPEGVSKGYFGSATEKALANFQFANGISPADGYFGSMTREWLNTKCSGNGYTASNISVVSVDGNVSIDQREDSFSERATYSMDIDLRALDGDVYIPDGIKWISNDMNRDLYDVAANIVIENSSGVLSNVDYTITGMYSFENAERLGNYWKIKKGETARLNFDMAVDNVKTTDNYRMRLIGFAYKSDPSDAKPKIHVMDVSSYSTYWANINSYYNSVPATPAIKVSSPEDGTVYDGGTSQKITTKWSKYNGDFDYYRVIFGNSVIGEDFILKNKVNKKDNGYTISSEKLQKLIQKNWKTVNLPLYFKIEAIKKEKGRETVVATGSSGVFNIKSPSKDKKTGQVSIASVSKGELIDGKRWDMYDFLLSSSGSKATQWDMFITCSDNIGELSMKAGGACGEVYTLITKTNTATVPVYFDRLDISPAYATIKVEAYSGSFDKNDNFVKKEKVGEASIGIGLAAG
jgi:peptidoglycan hydrolase-like protein with peptidoglycan-binding domain